MSVRWFDGFDFVATAHLPNDYRAVAGGVTIGTGRDSTSGAEGATNADSMIRDCAPTNAVRGAVGMAIYVSAFPGAARKIFTLLDAADSPVFTLVLRTDGYLEIVRGGSVANTPYLTSSTLIGVADWTYVEIGFQLASSDGTLVLRVDGILHVQSGALAYDPPLTWAAVELFPDEGLDDLYIVDGSGAANWLLTPQRVWSVAPGSVGDVADWTSSSGVGPVDDIDESPHNSDTDYIWAAGDEEISTFIMALTGTMALGPIHAVSLNFVARDASLSPGDVGPMSVRPVARSEGVTHTVPAISEALVLTDTYAFSRYTWTVDPATLVPWTHTTLGATQFGVERHE